MQRVKFRVAVAVVLAALLSGCGIAGPEEFGQDEKNVTVGKGEKFALSVPVEVGSGEWWYLTKPTPDTSVVRSAGKKEELEGDEGAVGSGSGTDLFKFEAVGPGTTRIHLIQCPPGACSGGRSTGGIAAPAPVPSGSPTPLKEYRATVHTYTVNVTA